MVAHMAIQSDSKWYAKHAHKDLNYIRVNCYTIIQLHSSHTSS